MQFGVISEEGDRQSESGSAEASPLEIFVQQFPPSDDNDGEAPRRESGSCTLELEQESIKDGESPVSGDAQLSGIPTDRDHSVGEEDCHEMRGDADEREFDRVQLSGKNREESNIQHQDYHGLKCDEIECPQNSSNRKKQSPMASSVDSGTQTDPVSEKENFNPTTNSILLEPGEGSKSMACGNSTTGSSSVATSTGNNRLAALLIWRNNQVWKSLTEVEHEENHTCESDLDESFPGYLGRWDVRYCQPVSVEQNILLQNSGK